MEALQEKLELADLRASGELLAEITAVEGRSASGTLSVEVTYEFVDTRRDITVESTDVFDVPVIADPAYDFYRLCQAQHVSLETATETLVGSTVPIEWTGTQWEIVLPDRPDTVEDEPPTLSAGDDLRTALELAAVRSSGELLAEITAVGGTETAEEGSLEVAYTAVDEQRGVTIESTDVFDVPSAEDPSYAFYRLCESKYVSLGSATEELIGMGVEIYWDRDDCEWTINIPGGRDDESAAMTPDESIATPQGVSRLQLIGSPNHSLVNRVRKQGIEPWDLSYAGLFAIFPIVSPLVFVHYWARRGVLSALGFTLAVGGLWLFLLITLLQIIPPESLVIV